MSQVEPTAFLVQSAGAEEASVFFRWSAVTHSVRWRVPRTVRTLQSEHTERADGRLRKPSPGGLPNEATCDPVSITGLYCWKIDRGELFLAKPGYRSEM